MNKLHLLIPLVFLAFIIPLVLSQTQIRCTSDTDCLERGLTNHFCNTTTGFCQPKQDVQTTPGSGIIVPPTETSVTTPQQTSIIVPSERGCADSDGGKNYYISGSTKIVGNQVIDYTDFCLPNQTDSKNILREYYCNEDTVDYVDYDCEKESKFCDYGMCLDEGGIITYFNIDLCIYFPRSTLCPNGIGREKEFNPTTDVVTMYEPLTCRFRPSRKAPDDVIMRLKLITKSGTTEETRLLSEVNPKCSNGVCEHTFNEEKLFDKETQSAEAVCEVDYKGRVYKEKLNVAKLLFLVDAENLDELNKPIVRKDYNPDTGEYDKEVIGASSLERFKEALREFISRTILSEKDYKVIYRSLPSDLPVNTLGELRGVKDTTIHYSKKVVGDEAGWVLKGTFVIFLNEPIQDKLILAHEMGHVYGDLSDEYRSSPYAPYDVSPACLLASKRSPFYLLRCEEIGGFKTNFQSLRSNYYLCKDMGLEVEVMYKNIREDENPVVCCITKDQMLQLGNGCDDPGKGERSDGIPSVYVLTTLSGKGTPLDENGNLVYMDIDRSLLNNIEVNFPMNNIYSEYRSIMGRSYSHYNYTFIYPNYYHQTTLEGLEITQGTHFPLKPGLPKAA